ncbi:hypothetical protein BSKO_13514 [Bryopsis sp. KO-2023]|nr:hypothetical protein BSKO_13514 [Bryopsis sp. KO-2023]
MGRMTLLSPYVPSSDAIKVSTGTTICAISYDGGVVLACDTRVTVGPFVSNRGSDKIVPLCDNVHLCRSGSAADTQTVSDYVRYYAEQHAISLGTDPDVWTVANLVSQINYRNKHLSAYMLVAGWDAAKGGQVFSVVMGGTVVQEKWAIDGSGSSYIWGVCDAMYKDGMTREEAEEMAISVTGLALSSDGGSGGMCRLVTIDKNGVTRRLVRPHEFPPMPFELVPPEIVEEGSGGMILD